MTKRLTTAAVLSACLLSTASAQEQPIPDTGTSQQQDSGYSGLAGESVLPVPQEAFVDITYPCREARTLYNLLMSTAEQRRPGEWSGVWVTNQYGVSAAWRPGQEKDLLVRLRDGETTLVSFWDGGLDGEVDGLDTPDGLRRPRDLWDTIFYRWTLDNVLQIVHGEANSEDDKALVFFAREQYAH